MFITIHAATAAIIGENISSAPLAFAIGLVSHFILDIIPHGDQKLGRKFFGRLFREGEHADSSLKSLTAYGAMDAFVLVLFVIYLFRTFDFRYPDSVTWAIIGGILPDLLVGVYVATKVKWLEWFFKFHNKNHHLLLNRLKSDIPIELGVFLQIIVLMGLVWLFHQ